MSVFLIANSLLCDAAVDKENLQYWHKGRFANILIYVHDIVLSVVTRGKRTFPCTVIRNNNKRLLIDKNVCVGGRRG